MNHIVHSRAPVRICDIGGWTDTWFYPNGAVFNFCVDLYNYVVIRENNSNQIQIHSDNLNLTTQIKTYKDIEYNGQLDLLKAVIKKIKIENGIDINIRSETPPGCGTGTSASVSVALIGALFAYLEEPIDPLKVAELAHKVEIDELKLQSGVQDQYAAALGGVNFMEVSYPSVKVTPIDISKKKRFEIENSLILLLFGSRSSSDMHKAVIQNYLRGDNEVIESLNLLKSYAYKMKDAIKKSIDEMGNLMNQNWNAQKRLHPLMINKSILKAERIAQHYNALGFKCNGAGGGGSATILADPDKLFLLKKELMKEGYEILPCKLSFDGVFSYIQ